MKADEKLPLLQTRKVVVGMIIAGIVILTVIFRIFVYNCTKIRGIDGQTIPIKSLSDGYAFALDECIYEGDGYPLTRDMLQISGWLIKRGENSKGINLRIVLNNTDTGEYLLLPTMLAQRADVTSAYNDGHNYDNSGFSVCLPLSAVDFDNFDYSLMALYSLNGDACLIDLDVDIPQTKKGNI